MINKTKKQKQRLRNQKTEIWNFYFLLFAFDFCAFCFPWPVKPAFECFTGQHFSFSFNGFDNRGNPT